MTAPGLISFAEYKLKNDRPIQMICYYGCKNCFIENSDPGKTIWILNFIEIKNYTIIYYKKY